MGRLGGQARSGSRLSLFGDHHSPSSRLMKLRFRLNSVRRSATYFANTPSWEPRFRRDAAGVLREETSLLHRQPDVIYPPALHTALSAGWLHRGHPAMETHVVQVLGPPGGLIRPAGGCPDLFRWVSRKSASASSTSSSVGLRRKRRSSWRTVRSRNRFSSRPMISPSP